MQDAVIGRLEIIGEAVKNLPTSFRDKHKDIPWKRTAGLRDILMRDLYLTWQVVKHELPKLKKKIIALLQDLL